MKRWLLILVPLVALGILISWRINQKNAQAAQEAKTAEARKKAPSLVEVATVKRRDVLDTFEAVGTVEAPLTVDLIPEVTGRITSLTAREGDHVKAGQLLVRIDPEEVNAEVRNREAARAQAQARLAEGQLTQNPESVALSTELRRQQAALTTADAQYRQVRADREAQISTAQAQVADAQSKVASAEANIAAAEAAVKTAEANLANAQTELTRQEMLYKEGATAKQVLDNAQTAFEVAKAARDEAVQKQQATVAARDSTLAQKKVAQKQEEVVRNKATADLAASNAAREQARATLAAAQANTGRNPAIQQNINALQAVVRAADADLAASKSRLSDTNLRAPLAGVVTARNLDPGAMASPSRSILSIQALDTVWMTLSVPEEISRRLYVGQEAKVTLDALSGETFTGKVAQVLPAADIQSRQFTVRLRLPNPKGRLQPGTFGRAQLILRQEKNALTVPLEAIKKDEKEPNKATVTLVGEDDKAVVRPVTTGLADAKVISVTSGVSEGDKVVILAGREIKDGQAVKVPKPGGGKGKGSKSGDSNSGNSEGQKKEQAK